MLESIYLGTNNWLILNRIISIREQYLKPFNHIYPTPPLGQDMTQGQFLSGV